MSQADRMAVYLHKYFLAHLMNFSLTVVGSRVSSLWQDLLLSDFMKTAQGLSWESWVGVGPSAVVIPFKLVQQVLKLVIAPKLKTVKSSEALARRILFDVMGEDQRRRYADWRAADSVNRGTEPGILERQWGEMMHKSVQNTWAGYFDVVPVLHADWGFDPRLLDDEHISDKRILVVSTDEQRLPRGAATWLVAAYKNSWLRHIDGSELAGLWEMDSIWAEYFGDSAK
jgi:hypothetical protein